VFLPIDPRITADRKRFGDWRRWAVLHDIWVTDDDQGLRAFIPIRCSALQDDKTCGAYATRPEMCKRFPVQPADLETVQNVCAYSFVDVEGGAPPLTG
jgi:Fe-S-cluster containining protein